MKYFYYSIICLTILNSCSTKNQLIYLKDIKKQEANSWIDIPLVKNRIEVVDYDLIREQIKVARKL